MLSTNQLTEPMPRSELVAEFLEMLSFSGLLADDCKPGSEEHDFLRRQLVALVEGASEVQP